MADYFLAKRGEYSETNHLLKDIADIFEDPKKPGEIKTLDHQKLR